MSHIVLNQVELWLNPIEWTCTCSCCCHFRVKFVKVSIIADVLVYRFNHVCCTKYDFVKTTMSLKLGPAANIYKLVIKYRRQKTGWYGLMEMNEDWIRKIAIKFINCLLSASNHYTVHTLYVGNHMEVYKTFLMVFVLLGFSYPECMPICKIKQYWLLSGNFFIQHTFH